MKNWPATAKTSVKGKSLKASVPGSGSAAPGLGNGVAIPHGRVKGTDRVEVSFMRLKKPLAFDAIDGEPVDLLFALAVPESCGETHLKLLSQVAEIFSDHELLKELRSADDSGRLLKLLSQARH